MLFPGSGGLISRGLTYTPVSGKSLWETPIGSKVQESGRPLFSVWKSPFLIKAVEQADSVAIGVELVENEVTGKLDITDSGVAMLSVFEDVNDVTLLAEKSVGEVGDLTEAILVLLPAVETKLGVELVEQKGLVAAEPVVLELLEDAVLKVAWGPVALDEEDAIDEELVKKRVVEGESEDDGVLEEIVKGAIDDEDVIEEELVDKSRFVEVVGDAEDEVIEVPESKRDGVKVDATGDEEVCVDDMLMSGCVVINEVAAKEELSCGELEGVLANEELDKVGDDKEPVVARVPLGKSGTAGSK